MYFFIQNKIAETISDMINAGGQMTTSLGNSFSAVPNVQSVERIIAESAKSVSQSLLRELLAIFKEKTKNFSCKLDEKLSKSDEQTQRVYKKLYRESELFISNDDKVSAAIKESLLAIEKVTHNSDVRRQLLGFFVLAEATRMVEKLQKEMPTALENKKNWE